MTRIRGGSKLIPSKYKVYVAKSKIVNSGKGLFAKDFIRKGERVCTYGGSLVDDAEARYLDPTYIAAFEPGKGYKLVGDNIDGDFGHFANSIHPESEESLKQNARFCFQNKEYLTNQRGRFELIAISDIFEGDEIIVKYGDSYWRRMGKWHRGELPVKSRAILNRDARAKRRHDRIYGN